MGTVTVDVGIFEGVSPDGINVVIYKIDGDGHPHPVLKNPFHSQYSFVKDFEIEPGNYSMRVSGFNPNAPGAYTIIKVWGDFSEGPDPDGYRNTTDRLIREIFDFKI